MGIADDIRPKKYRPIESKTEKAARKKAKKEIHNREVGPVFVPSHSEENDFFGGTPISHELHRPKRHNLGWLYTLIIIVVIASLLGLVVWQNYSVIKSFFDGSQKETNKDNLSQLIDSANTTSENYSSTTANQAPAASTTTPTTAPVIDKKTINISVLNGSGVKSSAQTVAGILATAGFTVSGTGNAKSFNYQKTFIYHKTGGENKAQLIKESLSSYQAEILLSDSIVGATHDIVVVVGKT